MRRGIAIVRSRAQEDASSGVSMGFDDIYFKARHRDDDASVLRLRQQRRAAATPQRADSAYFARRISRQSVCAPRALLGSAALATA